MSSARLRRRVLAAALLAAGLAGFDFLRFLAVIERPPAAAVDSAEAVVVLTGAPGRVAAGAELAERLGLPLLISGVSPQADAIALLATRHGLDPAALVALAPDLGTEATTTEGNGIEAACWARRRGYRRLAVVTSRFHMPRALVELRRFMPEVRPLPVAVPTLLRHAGDWYRSRRVGALVIEEWLTLRAAQLRARLFSAPARAGARACGRPGFASLPAIAVHRVGRRLRAG